MLENLPMNPPAEEVKNGPSDSVVDTLIQYSKSVEVKKSKTGTVLIHLN